jgi:hypothetical protein
MNNKEFKIKWWHIVIVLAINWGTMYFIMDKAGDKIDAKINQSMSKTDSLKGRSEVIREIYNNNKTTNFEKTLEIVHKYDSLPLNMDSVNCNAKLNECAKDVKTQATMLKECYSDCDTLTASKDNIIKNQDRTITLLKNKKISPFGVFGGVGLGVNHKGEINPTAVIGVGIKLK